MAYNYEYPYTDPGLYNDDWLINKVKQLAAEWEDMKVKFTTLEEYVKNYFSNLDVSEEINQKIDEMAADGFFDDIYYNSVPIPSQWKYPVVCIGGDYAINSVNAYGQPLLRAALSNSGFGTITDLSESGLSLMAPGKNFYTVLEEYYASVSKKPKFTVILPELSDGYSSYTNTQIITAFRNIARLAALNSSFMIEMTPLPDCSNPHINDLKAYRRFCEIGGRNYPNTVMWMPFVAQSTVENGHLNVDGVTLYVQIIQSQFLYPLTPNYILNKEYILTLNNRYSFRMTSSLYHSVSIQLSITFNGQNENFNFPFPVKNVVFSVVSSSGVSGYCTITDNILSTHLTSNGVYYGEVTLYYNIL